MRLPVLAALLAAMLSACVASAAPPSENAGFISGDGSAQLIPAAEREPAPDVRAETLDGDTLELSTLDGVVVVNFWASWCGPCAREAPQLQAFADAYADRGVHLVGVDVKDERANALAFERDFGITYPSYFDEAAAIAASFGGIGPAALPSTLVLDADHRVAVRLFGAVTAAQLESYVDPLLREA
jgi:thiol-disulfide isomerase/thioredoxin